LFRLDGLGPNAYEAFQASRDLRAVVNKVQRAKDGGSDKGELTKTVSVSAQLMTPIQPMLVLLLMHIVVVVVVVVFWLNSLDLASYFLFISLFFFNVVAFTRNVCGA